MSLPKHNSVEPPRYGSVCQVVWEGRCREAPPYPDHERKPAKLAWRGDIHPRAEPCFSGVMSAIRSQSTLEPRRDGLPQLAAFLSAATVLGVTSEG